MWDCHTLVILDVEGRLTNCGVNILELFMVVAIIWGLTTIIINVDVIVIISIVLIFCLWNVCLVHKVVMS